MFVYAVRQGCHIFRHPGMEYGTNILDAFSFFVQCLIRLLHDPKRYVQGCENYVLMENQWFVENVFNTNIELLHGRSSISCPMIFSVVAVPQAKKTWVLGVTRLLPNRKFINFRWTQTIQLCSLCLLKTVFTASYFSFIVVEWLSGTAAFSYVEEHTLSCVWSCYWIVPIQLNHQ